MSSTKLQRAQSVLILAEDCPEELDEQVAYIEFAIDLLKEYLGQIQTPEQFNQDPIDQPKVPLRTKSAEWCALPGCKKLRAGKKLYCCDRHRARAANQRWVDKKRNASAA